LVPFGAVIAGSLMAITRSSWFWPCAALYLAATGIEAVRVSRQELASPWLVWAIFPVLHAAHGTGFAAGLLRYGGEREWNMPPRLKPRPRLEQVA
jgi:hypothetical protein